ncbi:MAG: mannitol dehydrogenase family protein [Rikenellaceae bacterium]
MKTNSLNISYNKQQIKSGILHFGVGNFHRAHLQCYTNQLLSDESQSSWGICGAMLMPQDERLYKVLKAQDNNYSLTVCGRDGVNETQWIGSLVELLWSGEDSEAIINKVADKDIKIITLTITEGGYNTDKSTGEFIFDNEMIQHDLENTQNPKTVFGFVAEGLRRRKMAGNGAVTILSCDNLQHNGNTCKKVFTAFIEKQDAELAEWVKTNVTFPNSMVDRITPATTIEDIDRINQTLDVVDNAPVYCEDFIQWVVEDDFIAGRPAWEKVGVEFTDDVTPYENMKLSLLNASHTLLSYPSMLSGFRKVDVAMKDDRIIKFVRTFMDKDVTPYVPAPKNTDLDVYKQTLVERFANSAVSDQIARLCGDGASKFPVYVMPIASKMVENGDDMIRVAYLIAAYRHYLKYQKDDRGETFTLFEPWLTEGDFEVINSDDAVAFLALEPFSSVDLAAHEPFKTKYLKLVEQIKAQGAMSVLELLELLNK